MSTRSNAVLSCIRYVAFAGPHPSAEEWNHILALARAAVRRAWWSNIEDVDLVQELLLRLLELSAARPEALERLTEAGPAQATAFVQRVLFNLARNSAPGRRGYRALSKMVAQVMAEGVPPRTTQLPSSLFHRGRLSRKLVEQACGFFSATEPDASAGVVTSALADHYGMGTPRSTCTTPVLPTHEGDLPSSQVETKQVALRIEELMLERLGEHGRDVLAVYRLGLTGVSKRLGLPISTVASRLRRAEARLKDLARHLDASPAAVETALARLSVSCARD